MYQIKNRNLHKNIKIWSYLTRILNYQVVSYNKKKFNLQGWYSILQSFDGLMRVRNTRTSLFHLYSKIEALLWTIECMKNLRYFWVTFTTDCSQFMKMISEQKNDILLQVIWKILRPYKRVFFFSSEIIYIPQTQNYNVDSLA